MGWREIIRSEYKGYKVDVPDLPIKLSRNENPFDLPQELKEEVFKDLSEISWNRYPDGKSSKLRERLSSFLNIPSENIMVGLGSGDLIQIIANGILKPKDKVILPVPTFSLYEKIFEQKEAEILKIYLNKDNFSININELKNSWNFNPKLLVITNPNNPTGNLLLKEDDVLKLKDFPGLILIDEAYYEFSDVTFLPYIKEIPNLMILRTFSKAFSAAGVRIGYLIANPNVIEFLGNYKLPYNLNIFSQVVGIKVLDFWNMLKKKIDIIKEEKEKTYNRMKELRNLEVYPSHTNFLLFRSAKKEIILKKCEENGISLRDFSREPLLENCLRVSIGSSDENERFLKTIREVLL